MTELGFPSVAWKTTNELSNLQTSVRESDIFSHYVRAQMSEGGNANSVSRYARLTSITFHLSTDVKDPVAVRYIRGSLMNINLPFTLLKSHENHTREGCELFVLMLPRDVSMLHT